MKLYELLNVTFLARAIMFEKGKQGPTAMLVMHSVKAFH